AAERPRLADFLRDVPPSEQSAVFCSLLSLELQCRKQNGEQPTPLEYLAQFPESAPLVLSVFQESGLLPRDSTSALPGQSPKTRPELGSDNRATVSFDPSHQPSSATDGKANVNGARPAGTESTEPLQRLSRHKRKELPKVPGYEILAELGK